MTTPRVVGIVNQLDLCWLHGTNEDRPTEVIDNLDLKGTEWRCVAFEHNGSRSRRYTLFGQAA